MRVMYCVFLGLGGFYGGEKSEMTRMTLPYESFPLHEVADRVTTVDRRERCGRGTRGESCEPQDFSACDINDNNCS